MTIQLAYKQLLVQLYDVYDNREAANIADWVIENVTGQNKLNRIIYKDLPVSADQHQSINEAAKQLLLHRPIQYILQEAWFAGSKFYVNDNVLIPRPETEELVDWVIDDLSQVAGENAQNKLLLDVGTGSGCIALSLKKKLRGSTLYAVDVSEDALAVAKKNATEQQIQVTFIQMNFLQKSGWQTLGKYDAIVSNPPYIKNSEAGAMSANVLQYEPGLALFVPNEDPLLFYKAIAEFAVDGLAVNGAVYVEINEALGQQVVDMFHQKGFAKVELRKDMQQKDRMVKAVK